MKCIDITVTFIVTTIIITFIASVLGSFIVVVNEKSSKTQMDEQLTEKEIIN